VYEAAWGASVIYNKARSLLPLRAKESTEGESLRPFFTGGTFEIEKRQDSKKKGVTYFFSKNSEGGESTFKGHRLKLGGTTA